MIAFYTYRLNGVHFRATEDMNMGFDVLVMWVVTQKPTIKKIKLRLAELRTKHAGSQESWAPVLTAFKNAMNQRKHKHKQ